MRIYITKYALSAGPLAAEGDFTFCSLGHVHATWIDKTGYKCHSYFFGPDWHLAWESALANCEQRRDAKVKSLNKQLAKLNKLTFTCPEPYEAKE